MRFVLPFHRQVHLLESTHSLSLAGTIFFTVRSSCSSTPAMPRETDPLLGNHHRNSSYDHEPATPSWRARLAEGLSEEIDVAACGPALACQCMIAGAADVAAYSQSSTWAAFMVRAEASARFGGSGTGSGKERRTLVLTYPTPLLP